MRARSLAVVLVALSVLSAGCASTGQPDSSRARARSAATHDSSRSAGPSAPSGPSAPAKIICGDEIRTAIPVTQGLPATPRSTSTWADQIFTCSYTVGGGTLALSVEDSPDTESGSAYFADLQSRLPGAQALPEAATMGLPSFATPDGNVAFLKDGKTLRVDASGLPATSLPTGSSSGEVAYAVAAAVVGCWTE